MLFNWILLGLTAVAVVGAATIPEPPLIKKPDTKYFRAWILLLVGVIDDVAKLLQRIVFVLCMC
jgi:hypothetical protein